MTTSTAQNPPKSGAGALIRGFASGLLAGSGPTCVVVGPVIGDMSVLLLGVVLILGNIALLVAWRTYANRRNGPRPAPRLALARIESRRAQSAEVADIPVEFVLTVAPDDAPAFRVYTTQDINLVDIPDYKPRGVLVVEYRPDRPWDVTIVTQPDEAWARRAATESIDAAPESTLVTAPLDSCGTCLLAFVGFLVGAAVVLVAFRGELFDDDAPDRSSTTTVTSTSTSSTTVTITGEVMLLPGEMRKAADELIALAGTDKAVDFGIDEDFMTLEAPKPADPRLVDAFRFRDGKARSEGPRGTRTADGPLIDLRALPYDRLPALVAEAKTTLGLTAPKSWHISFDIATDSGALEIRVSVQDEYGGVSLTADANGTVTDRRPR